MIPHLLLVAISGFLLIRAANWLVRGVGIMAEYLAWKEFVVAFFVMAIGASLPNLFIGFSSIAHGIPELSFGDILGNSVADLTLVAAIAALFMGKFSTKGKTVQTSSLITAAIALLPLLLIADGVLSRGDGMVLILLFIAYASWMISRRHAHGQIFEKTAQGPPAREFKKFLKGFAMILGGGTILFFSAEGIVRAAEFFAAELHLPVMLLGILGLGLGSALPELYFAVAAAKAGKYWVVLGEITGSIIILNTLVLGIVAILQPITLGDPAHFTAARVFMIIAALFFLMFVRSGKMVTKKEALWLISLYLLFFLAELYTKAWCQPSTPLCLT